MDSDKAGSVGKSETGMRNQDQLDTLLADLVNLVERMRALAPGHDPPPSSSGRWASCLQEILKPLSVELRSGIQQRFRKVISADLVDPDTWRGLWYLIDYTLRLQADIVKRRFTGDYETDDWGLDIELLEMMIPFFTFMYETYWRVETTGIENIPHAGRALMVSNHSGHLPWDALMIGAAVWNEHPSQRLVRSLFSSWINTTPVLSALLVKMGQTLATVENGSRLLDQDELVAVFPEGESGLHKLYRDRYRLAHFGRGGFVKMALRTRAPIIPVSVVGAEETYIALAESRTLARLSGLSHFPLTLTFPWLGLLGLVPLPSKWYIDFGEPISTSDHGPDASRDLMLITRIKAQVRDCVEQMINSRLAERRFVFL